MFAFSSEKGQADLELPLGRSRHCCESSRQSSNRNQITVFLELVAPRVLLLLRLGADALGDEQLVELDPAQHGDVQPLQLFALLR